MTDAADAIAAARAALRGAADELAAASARDEALAEYVPDRRALGFVPVAARMRKLGRVWRLGALLVDADGTAYATGQVVRAARPVRKSVVAEAVAAHRALAAAAAKGGFPEGETVNFEATPIDLDGLRDGTGHPLVLVDGEVRVRWNAATPDATMPLDRYLAERVGLLVRPPLAD